MSCELFFLRCNGIGIQCIINSFSNFFRGAYKVRAFLLYFCIP